MRFHKRFWMKFKGRNLPEKRRRALAEFEQSRTSEFFRKESEAKITNKAGFELRKSVLQTKKATEEGKGLFRARVIVNVAKKQGIDKKTAVEYAKKFGSEEIAEAVKTEWGWVKGEKEDEYSHLK